MFRPRLTLGILYVLGFFFVYCLAFVAPALWEVWRMAPSEPELAVGVDIARETLQPRLWMALVAAVLTTALGMARGALPGTGSGGRA